jgi:hypothetical protein
VGGREFIRGGNERYFVSPHRIISFFSFQRINHDTPKELEPKEKKYEKMKLKKKDPLTVTISFLLPRRGGGGGVNVKKSIIMNVESNS